MDPAFVNTLGEIGKVGGPWLILVILVAKFLWDGRSSHAAVMSDQLRKLQESQDSNAKAAGTELMRVFEALLERNAKLESVIEDVRAVIGDVRVLIAEQTAVLREIRAADLARRG